MTILILGLRSIQRSVLDKGVERNNRQSAKLGYPKLRLSGHDISKSVILDRCGEELPQVLGESTSTGYTDNRRYPRTPSRADNNKVKDADRLECFASRLSEGPITTEQEQNPSEARKRKISSQGDG